MSTQRKKQASAISQEWEALNDKLREASEEECRELLKTEQEGPNRLTYIKRIHSRLNKVRADRERAEFI